MLNLNRLLPVIGVLLLALVARPCAAHEGEPRLDQPAAPITDRGVANIEAFAAVYGRAKYFHPSEAASKCDWSALALAGVQRVERCATPAELADAFRAIFSGVCAGADFWSDGAAPPRERPQAPPAEGARIIGWVHDGVSFGPEFAAAAAGRNIYRSTRIKESAGSPPQGKERRLPAPGTMITGNVGGVSWRIPAVLPLDSRGFTPQPDDPAAPPPTDVRTAKGFRPSGNDRATRLADVVIAWSLLENFYPYFDAVKTDWRGALTRSLRQAATDADERAFLRTLRSLIADLRDGHGSVYCLTARPTTGLPCGWRFVGDDLIVTSGGPGAGGPPPLRPGDRIVAVDGRSAADLWADWRTQTSAATAQWARFAAARSLLAYAPAHDPSTVVVERAGQTLTLSVPLVPADKLTLNDPARPADGAAVGRVDGREGHAGEIVYFNLSGAKDEAFNAILDGLAGAGGIVFDLRGYPDSAATTALRHLTDAPIRSAKWVIPCVTLPGGIDGGGWRWVESKGRWTLPPLAPRLGGVDQPVVFLTDGRAISYAESIMGIVEAYKLGEIVGSATAGTNGNINPFTLPGGYTVSWTGMRVIKHDDSAHHGVGIAPTVPCEPTRAGIAAGRDEVLERAVEVIKARLSR